MENRIRSITDDIIILADNGLWQAEDLASDLSKWAPGDPVEIVGPFASAKMTNLRKNESVTVSASRLAAKGSGEVIR